MKWTCSRCSATTTTKSVVEIRNRRCPDCGSLSFYMTSDKPEFGDDVAPEVTNGLTASDRRFLTALRIGWEEKT